MSRLQNQGQGRGFFDVSSGRTYFLDLPQSVRVKIYRLLGYSYTKILRLVCSTFKTDIETVAGISSAIDSTFEDFPFHCAVAIHKVSIHELISPAFVEFLKYPLVLEILEIRGEISLKNFNYIIKSCLNLRVIEIIFNKFVLDCNTKMFPLPEETRSAKPFSKLHTIKLIAVTKKWSEINYVYKNVMGFIQDSLLDVVKIKSLHLLVAHRISSPLLKEIMATTLRFMHRHVETLEYLNLTFRDKDPTASSSESSPSRSNTQQETPKPTSQDPKAEAKLETMSTSTSPLPSPGSDMGSVKPTTSIKPPPAHRKKVGPVSKPAVKTSVAESTSTEPQPTSSNEAVPKEVASSSERKKSNESQPPPKIKTQPKERSLPGVVITHHVKDVHGDDPSKAAGADKTGAQADDLPSTALPTEAEGEANIQIETKKDKVPSDEVDDIVSKVIKFIQSNPWPIAKHLDQVILAVPLRVLECLATIVSKQSKISVLNLEGYGGDHTNWQVYKEFVKKACPLKLESAIFHHTNHTDDKGKALPISLGIFKRCRSLKKLTLLCEKKEDFSKLSCASHVSSLPMGLHEVTFERLTLSACQAIRLAYCFPEIQDITLEYWTASDRQFANYLCMLKWLIKWDCTNASKITLIETKIRFRNERKAVLSLQKAVKIHTRYIDKADTRLLLDVKETPSDNELAPAINLRKQEDDKYHNPKNLPKAERKKAEAAKKEAEASKKVTEHHKKDTEHHKKAAEHHKKETEHHKKETEHHKKETEHHTETEHHKETELNNKAPEVHKKGPVVPKKGPVVPKKGPVVPKKQAEAPKSEVEVPKKEDEVPKDGTEAPTNVAAEDPNKPA